MLIIKAKDTGGSWGVRPSTIYREERCIKRKMRNVSVKFYQQKSYIMVTCEASLSVHELPLQ